MCDTLNDEIGRLVESLIREHGGAVTAVVVLIYVTTCLFTHYGDDHGVDLRPLLAVQRGAGDIFRPGKGLVAESSMWPLLAFLARTSWWTIWRVCRGDRPQGGSVALLLGGAQTTVLLLNL